MKISTEDLPKIEHLIEEIRNSSSVYSDSLVEFYDNSTYQTEFKRLSGILIKLKVCDFKKSQLGDLILLPNQNTFDFDLEQYIKEEENKDAREKLEYRKTQVDLELAEKMLKEYPKTKWFARIGFYIGIALAIFELAKWIIDYYKTN